MPDLKYIIQKSNTKSDLKNKIISEEINGYLLVFYILKTSLPEFLTIF